jgi:putative transposase
MPFVRIWVHLVWSTKNSVPSMLPAVRTRIFEHMKSNAREKKIWLDSLNGYSDHVHALVLLAADQSVSKVAQLLKGESSHWANQEHITPTPFEWQDEYCALSVSESAVEAVRRYIERQQEHHRKKTFGEEYEEFMKEMSSED